MSAAFARASLLLWAFAMTVLIGSLMATHWIVLPAPAVGDETKLADAEACENLQVFHVLYMDCPCARRIAEHLGNRGRLKESRETVLLLGQNPDMAKRMIEAGFLVESLTSQELFEKHGIESSPLLLVTDRDGTVIYSGGYTDVKQGIGIRDVEIIRKIAAGKTVMPLPVFGCAVSERLQKQTDPLRLKY